MSLENLKIEINPQYNLDFMKYMPSKRFGCNNVSLYAIQDVFLRPRERKLVSLEFKLLVDENHVFMIMSNEDLARSNGILVLQQVISSKTKDYINITLLNTTDAQCTIKKGDIIATGYLLTSPINYDIQVVKKV